MTLGKKLTLGFAFLINILILTSLVSYLALNHMTKQVAQLVEVESTLNEAAYDMEINIDETFSAIQGYMVTPDPELRKEANDAEADFERFEKMYRSTELSEAEKELIDQIDKDYGEATVARIWTPAPPGGCNMNGYRI